MSAAEDPGATLTRESPANAETLGEQATRRVTGRAWLLLLAGVLVVMIAGALGLRSGAQTAVLILVVVVALVFDYTNGFHDAANAIATAVSTRALTPRVALGMAAAMNMIGALLGVGVAKTISEVITPPSGLHGLTVVAAGVLGAITWNLITWYFGLPSSSSHALIGGVVGAGLASLSDVNWSSVVDKVAVPMVVSPVVGFCLAYLAMVAILWIFRRSNPSRVGRRFRIAQTMSAASLALGHGLQDAQKTMGIIVLALVTTGHSDGNSVPWWVIIACAGALSAGTYAGGWRIMRTLGRKVIEVDPPKGFAAEATASIVLYATAFIWHAPISTTHTITSAIMGSGATKRLSAVRWGVAGNILVAWVLTMPAAAAVAAAVYYVVHFFGA
ncbi:PiT family inorganic phosphate transporter [Actinomadura coerulea]|uniref:Phosphate transporter n=2 Tax=Actinomadura coerulea TaxID=46159 RepID=A0A7X0G536_9ACTN|nr:inorganic phosphate transporter [Actinomadura coerulea]MBB6399537.1 PiT family inorganic phosphate transporter [Actinomadura coerulea]GGQ12996.1 inorganic phosphate transporter [Actinomadura coerulea]